MKSIIKKLGKTSITVEKDYHSSNKEYNKLTVVEEQGAFKTYLSRKPVPVGIELTNREYWIPFSGVLESIVLDYLKFKQDYGSGKNLEDNAIITRHIRDRNVTGDKIADDSITTEKIVDDSIIISKLSTDIQFLINNLNKTATFAGIAIPTTNPGIPTAKTFYIANDKGIYNYFNNIEIIDDEVAILYFDTTWHKKTTEIASKKTLTNLKEKVDSLALGTFYGFYPDSSSLPIDITTSGYAYIGLDTPYKIWNFNGESWYDSGTSIDMNDADEEDITRNVDGKLQFKDKEYGDGMGHVILRKNKSFAEQVTKENTIYEIRYDFDLNGAEITILKDCILKFEGGSIKNGTINGSYTITSSKLYKIFNIDIFLKGSFDGNIFPEWFGAKGDGINDDSNYIQHIIDLDLTNTIFLTNHYYISNDLIINRKNRLSIIGNSYRDRNIDYKSTITSNTQNLFRNDSSSAKQITIYNVAFECENYTDNSNYVFNGWFNNSIIDSCYFYRYGTIFDNITNLSIVNNCTFFGIRKHFIKTIIDSTISNCYINASKNNKSWAISNVNSSKFVSNYIDFWKYFFIAGKSMTSSIFAKNNFDNIFRVFVGVYNCSIVGNIFSNISYKANNWGEQYLDDDMKTLKWCILSVRKAIDDFPEDFTYELTGLEFHNVTFIGNTSHDTCNMLYCDAIIYQPYNIYIANNIMNEESSFDYNFMYISSSVPNTRVGKNIYIDKLMYKEYDILPNPSVTSTNNANPCVVFNKQIIKIKNILYINIDGVWNKYKEAKITAGTTSKRPLLDVLDNNYNYYDTTIGKNIRWDGTKWIEDDNVLAGTLRAGRFESKPTIETNFIYKGFAYFCVDRQTTEGASNGIIIYHKGDNVWVDALGRVVE